MTKSKCRIKRLKFGDKAEGFKPSEQWRENMNKKNTFNYSLNLGEHRR